MKILQQLIDITDYPRIFVALGTFDGLHQGHQLIIGRAVELAREQKGTSVVLTFANHPLDVIAPERCPPLLLPGDAKAAIIANLGVDILISIPFTKEFLRLTPGEFIAALITNLRPAGFVVGPNYTFGHGGNGNPDVLRSAGRLQGFEVYVPPAVTINDRLASSTLIRQLVAAGDVAEAAVYLGRRFFLRGRVVDGAKRGRDLGFPTANLAVDAAMVMPADGVYAVTVDYEGITRNGVANIGLNPTFNGGRHGLEVHILNFTGDLYDRELDIVFWSRIRGERRFANPQLLADQIRSDIRQALSLLPPSGK